MTDSRIRLISVPLVVAIIGMSVSAVTMFASTDSATGKVLFSMRGHRQSSGLTFSRPFVIPKGRLWGIGWAYRCGGSPVPRGTPDLQVFVTPNRYNVQWLYRKTLVPTRKGIREARGYLALRGTGHTRYVAIFQDSPCSYAVVVTMGGVRVIPAYHGSPPRLTSESR
jgi:hypothetical protein